MDTHSILLNLTREVTELRTELKSHLKEHDDFLKIKLPLIITAVQLGLKVLGALSEPVVHAMLK